MIRRVDDEQAKLAGAPHLPMHQGVIAGLDGVDSLQDFVLKQVRRDLTERAILGCQHFGY